MIRFLIFISILIAYGSLYPFGFSVESYDRTQLDNLFYFGLNNTSRGDLISNVLLFLPFGFLSARVAPGANIGLTARWIVMLTAGFSLAYALQVLQLVVPGRTPSGADALLNLAGCVAGALAARVWFRARPESSDGVLPPISVPVILACLWIASHWAPFIPSLDFQLLKDGLKSVFRDSSTSGVWIFQNLVLWLVTFYFLQHAYPRLKLFHCCLLVPAVLLLSLFFVGNSISIDRFYGGLLAIPVWVVLRFWLFPAILAGLVALVIIGINFSPFELRNTPIDFQWIPFSGALSGNMLINVLATFKKSIIYGSLIWLLVDAGIRLRWAGLITAVFLFLCELSQIFFHSATPEITDALVAAFIAIAIHWYHQNIQSAQIVSTPPEVSSNNKVDAAGRSSSTLKNSNYIPGMDGLRAIAALAVFFVHFNQNVHLTLEAGPFDLERFLSNGNTGVALFFTLSGLLLSLPFWRSKIACVAPPDTGKYALRRIARILPAYYFCLFAIVIAKSLAGSGTSWNNILSHMFFIYNISDWNILSLNQPFWTLAVEMQFYILLPLFFLAFRKLPANATFYAFIILIPVLYLLNHVLVTAIQSHASWPIQQLFIWPFAFYLRGPDSWVLTYSTLAHLPHFLIGVVAAKVFADISSRGKNATGYRPIYDILIAASVCCIVLILSTGLDEVLQIPNGRYNFPVVPLLLAVIVVCVPLSRLASRFLETSVMVWLGVISYGIYIYHYPVQKIISRLLATVDLSVVDHPVLFGLSSLVVTLLCSQVSYLLVEAPVQRWTRQYLAGQLGFFGRKFKKLPRSAPAESTSLHPPDPIETKELHAQANLMGDSIAVNLRANQLDFLDLWAQSSGLSYSRIFGEIIEASKSSRSASEIDASLLATIPRVAPTLEQNFAHSDSWSTITVSLSRAATERLAAMTNPGEHSDSRRLRRLLQQCLSFGDGSVAAQRQGDDGSPGKGIFGPPTLRYGGALVLITLLAWFLFANSQGGAPSIREAMDWARRDASVVMDLHAHTTASDGALSIGSLSTLAIEHGCDALAVTDHSISPGTASGEQLSAAQSLRELHPNFRLFLGVELGMPSYFGREHAAVLVHPDRERNIIPMLRNLAKVTEDSAKASGNDSDPDKMLLDLMRRYREVGDQIFAVYNHPSRKVEDVRESLADLQSWNAQSSLFVAVAGAPGHQAHPNVGSYSGAFKTIDRWDPVVAQIGGVWDRYLSSGRQLWGALASSDFHNHEIDFAPCEFSRTHLSVPDDSYDGILDALERGAFWADHGRIADQLKLTAELEGLNRRVYPGEIVDVRADDAVAMLSLEVARGEGSVLAPLEAEFITNCLNGDFQLMASVGLGPQETIASSLLPLIARGSDDKSCVVRARLRLKKVGEADFMAYTNPIRFYF